MKYWIGERIRQARVVQGLTQAHLGGEIGYNQSYISKMEQGERDPGFHKVLLMLQVMGLTWAYLFPPPGADGVEPPPTG